MSAPGLFSRWCGAAAMLVCLPSSVPLFDQLRQLSGVALRKSITVESGSNEVPHPIPWNNVPETSLLVDVCLQGITDNEAELGVYVGRSGPTDSNNLVIGESQRGSYGPLVRCDVPCMCPRCVRSSPSAKHQGDLVQCKRHGCRHTIATHPTYRWGARDARQMVMVPPLVSPSLLNVERPLVRW